MAERTKWTPEMVERLHDLRDRNWTVLEITQDMGLPFEVVQGRINREKTGKLLDPAESSETGTHPYSGTGINAQEQTELLTKMEAWALADFIDFWLFDAIRKDTETENMRWLISVVHAFDKLCAFSGYKVGGGYAIEEEGQNNA